MGRGDDRDQERVYEYCLQAHVATLFTSMSHWREKSGHEGDERRKKVMEIETDEDKWQKAEKFH